MLVYEVIINFKRFLKCDILSFWKEDIYYSRLEAYVFGIPSGIVFIIYGIVSFSIADTVSMSSLLVVSDTLLYLFIGGFAIIMTFLKFIKSLISPPKPVDELIFFLKTEDGNQLMIETCKIEYSIENISCWNDIQDFKKLKSLEERKSKLDNFVNLYLNGLSSELELNIPKSIANEIIKKISQNQIENDILDVLEKSVIINMNDTYMRLILTKEFDQWKEHHKFLKDSNIE